MKAGWIEEFRAELAVIGDQNSSISQIAVHLQIDGDWVLGAGGPSKASLAKAMALSKPSGGIPYRKISAGQKRYLFVIHESDLVVDVEFNVFPRSAKLLTLASAIEKARDHSQYKFDAHHDSLTGCKNRKSFEIAMRGAIQSLVPKSSSVASSLGAGGVRSIALVAFDVDFFKRINDSRGHEYGDIVLRALSWLVEDACERANSTHKGVEFSVFRLGGEEFSILVKGDIDERELLAWVEGLRLEIEKSTVPTTSQLETIQRDSGLPANIPAENERRITASFGVARYVGVAGASDVAEISGRLKTQADKAVYSAKSSGRNRIRYFPDILKRYGKVLENDPAAGVVVIDVGSEVGVVRGREFFVVPERYAGDTGYVIDDGRSKRTLGIFPRVKVAKIVAFHVQPEISFCSITEHRDGTHVGPGCLLESIPLGTFGGLGKHYLNTDSIVGGDARKALKEKLSGVIDENLRVIAVRFPNIREVEKQYGSVKANELLAAATACMQRLLPSPAKIVQLEVGGFGAVFSSESLECVREVSLALREICGDTTDFSIGTFDRDSMASVAGSRFALDWANAYDYAAIAAAASEKNTFASFDESAPQTVLRASEEAGQYEKVEADYKRFRELGIVSGSLDNHLAISLFAAGDMIGANAALRSAVELKPDEPIIRSNFAITQFVTGNRVDSYNEMTRAIERLGREPDENVKGLYALAALASFRLTGVPSDGVVRTLFQAVVDVDSQFAVDLEELRSEINKFST